MLVVPPMERGYGNGHPKKGTSRWWRLHYETPPPFELRPVSSLLTFLKTVLFQRAFGGLITVALKLFLLGIFIALYSYAFYTGYVLI